MNGTERWWLLEQLGAYAAGELPPEEAREVERMINQDPEALRVAESYLRMIALLDAMGDESPEVPGTVISYAIRRAYISAFLRQAEDLLADSGRTYLDAFVYYFALGRPQSVE
ncbi:MAG: zf-HC2 domain-containing protein [Actinomycetota bacterium]|nr:zf-HC2 domain-containing protein [Actinomycetota bacterium]